MKRILSLLPLFLTFFATAAAPAAPAAPIFGGNLPPIRPAFVAADTPQFELALTYLKRGDVARAATLEWEVLWDPNGSYDYRGIDASIKLMARKGVVPLWLLQPSPHPSSPWYQTTWTDPWLPKRELWPAVVTMNTNVVQHIISESKKYLGYPPLFQIWNEPQGGKPGGSTTSKFGEWVPDMHELFYLLVSDLRSKGIPKSQLVAPAMSGFGEGTRGEAAEFASMMPPPEFDWLSECGFRACHIRFSATWANGNTTYIRQGFQNNIDWVFWLMSRQKWPVGQKVLVTEFYVTPGDCGVPMGTDMYPYHAIAFDILKASLFSHVLAWGLRPGETDNPNDPWSQYGGLGQSLVRWRG